MSMSRSLISDPSSYHARRLLSDHGWGSEGVVVVDVDVCGAVEEVEEESRLLTVDRLRSGGPRAWSRGTAGRVGGRGWRDR